MYCSILFITCISVQRYWVVAHPLSHQKKNNKIAIAVSVSIWAFIWLTTTPLYLYNHTANSRTSTSPRKEPSESHGADCDGAGHFLVCFVPSNIMLVIH
jgi:hypothetical protein